MAFGGFSAGDNNAPQSEINVVPLVDVMLVLLVIFIITAPLLTHAVKVELPRASSSVNQSKPDKIEFAIDAAGRLYWNGEVIDRAEMVQRFRAAGTRDPSPEIHLRAEKTSTYQAIADVMSEAAKAGLTKIGFVTDPREGN